MIRIHSALNFIILSTVISLGTPAFANSAGAVPTAVSAKALNQGTQKLIGKRVLFKGKVDRILGPGAYLMSDAQGSSKPSHRILVLTTGRVGDAAGPGSAGKRQQAGTAAPSFKEGQKVQLQGKVEELRISDEVERFSPKSHRETVDETAASTPVIVTRTADIHAQ